MLTKFVAIVILIIAKDVWGKQCRLNAKNMDRKWIYAVKNPANKYELLHTEMLKDQQKIFLICKSIKMIQLQCKKGKVSSIPPSITCSRRMRATITAIANEAACLQKGGAMYDVRYTLPTGKRVLSLYQVCYNKNTEEAIYSRHRAYGFRLSASTYKRPQFATGGVVSVARADSFEFGNVYNSFVRLLGSGQDYIKSANLSDRVMERGHLANSQDFLTYDQMDETFKYVNVMPQFGSINRRNWKRIENWIHNLPKNNQYAEVVTGGFEVLELPHSKTRKSTPMYLMVNNKNPIPKWTYKVVKYNGVCHAFVTYNNPYTNTVASNSPCLAVPCPTGLTFNPDLGSGPSNCCNLRYLVQKVGQQAALC
ncbi:uncharacterized protein LOC106095054 [Stomoxys calcitrans]|uniref:DNA/RNA non-specific endonuclease domain-containing protein n=1 Tax=Stomoxys calcitrans TaxID=35570 RepID=A0A1I8NPD2_STOCA|nr:uncharacterized protein LOC106095054 [Stomoxys calcitrans]